MKLYNAKDILNIAIAGHSGAGKTSIAEAMLYLSGATDRFGKVGEGNKMCIRDRWSWTATPPRMWTHSSPLSAA